MQGGRFTVALLLVLDDIQVDRQLELWDGSFRKVADQIQTLVAKVPAIAVAFRAVGFGHLVEDAGVRDLEIGKGRREGVGPFLALVLGCVLGVCHVLVYFVCCCFSFALVLFFSIQ